MQEQIFEIDTELDERDLDVSFK